MAQGWRKQADAHSDINRNMAAALADAPNDRRHGRMKPGLLSCNLGTVLDVSASGIRLRASKPLQGRQKVLLHDSKRAVMLVGQVVWTKKVGFRNHESGIQFLGLSAEDTAALRVMALYR